MELLCKAMLHAAEIIARANGYIMVAQEERFLHKDTFWGNVMVAYEYAKKHDYKKLQSYQYFKFIYPQFEEDIDENKSKPKIELDMHFGNPRVTVYGHDGAGSFCLSYKSETHQFSEAQVWGELGFPRAELFKGYIEEYLASHE